MTTEPVPLGDVALDVLTNLAQADPHPGRWHTRTPDHPARTTRAGYRAIQTTARDLLEEQPMRTAPNTEPTDQQRTHFPQLDVPCPFCNSPAGQLCTSHTSTRTMAHTIHQARRTTWADAAPGASEAATRPQETRTPVPVTPSQPEPVQGDHAATQTITPIHPTNHA